MRKPRRVHLPSLLVPRERNQYSQNDIIILVVINNEFSFYFGNGKINPSYSAIN